MPPPGRWRCRLRCVAITPVSCEDPAGREDAVHGEEPGAAGTRAEAEPSYSCQVCGRSGSGAELLQWVMDRRAGRASWTCPGCAATHIRALEAKLDPEWW